MKHPILFTASILFLLCSALRAADPAIEVVKIYDVAPHSAFTDLIRFKDRFYCAFREGTGHVPGKTTGDGDGTIRIIASADGKAWQSVAELKKATYDLRDAKISVTPDDRIMVLMGGSVYVDGKLTARHPQVSFSDKNGEHFSEPKPIEIDETVRSPFDWLWRVTWRNGIGYGLVYQPHPDKDWGLVLVTTTDGINYKSLKKFDIPGRPNEATVRFLPTGRMLIFLRCEKTNGQLGTSDAPYTDWTWSDLGMFTGGPDFIVLPKDRLIFGHRVHDKEGARTALSTPGPDGKLRVLHRLPSGGDTSYPGFVLHDEFLWVSYYSSHEGKTSIYLAKIPLADIERMLENP